MELGNSIATAVMAAMAEPDPSTEFLEQGATSAAFRIKTAKHDYVLRVGAPRLGKGASYEVDYAIRAALHEAKQPVARPIATDRAIDIGRPERWALDAYREGHHPERAQISRSVALAIGALLRRLHELPTAGWGRLKDTRAEFLGASSTATEGMLYRLEAPWPFTDAALGDDPVVQLYPALAAHLAPLEDALRAFVEASDAPVVIHSDLHEKQLLQHDDKLTAVLDFNDAVAGRREWDFGSFQYFHGDVCLSHLIDGYTDDPDEKRSLSHHATTAAVLIALHHGNRGVVLQRARRTEAAAQFLLRLFA